MTRLQKILLVGGAANLGWAVAVVLAPAGPVTAFLLLAGLPVLYVTLLLAERWL